MPSRTIWDCLGGGIFEKIMDYRMNTGEDLIRFNNGGNDAKLY